jgi:hypothetical protein
MSTIPGKLYSYNVNYSQWSIATSGKNIFIIGTNGLYVINDTIGVTIFGIVTTNTLTQLIPISMTTVRTTISSSNNISTVYNLGSMSTDYINTSLKSRICVDYNNNVWFTYTYSSKSYLCVISKYSNIQLSSNIASSNANKWYIILESTLTIIDINCDKNNNIYLSTSNNNVYVYTFSSTTLYSISINTAYALTPLFPSSGYIIDSLEGTPITTAQLYDPYGICFDKNNNLFIASYSGNVIYFLCKVSGNYYGRTCVQNTVYVLVTNNGSVSGINPTTNSISAAWYLSKPYALAIDPENNLYISCSNTARVMVIPSKSPVNNYFPITGSMAYAYTLAGTGTSSTNSNVIYNGVDPLTAIINAPVALAFDISNNLYIIDEPAIKYVRYIISSGYDIGIKDISFDLPNTKTVNAGNLQVSINDANNLATNQLYYWYSVNSPTTPNANSYVLNIGPVGSPYKFYILTSTTSINNTVYVQAKNANGDVSTIANTTVIVYQTPRAPPIFNVSFVNSGNIQVTVGESNPAPSDNYYLNNVSYVAYLYTGGTNQSGNLGYYTNNVGILANTNTTYGNVVSYIPNLQANTYTVYLAAKNDFGNSLSNIISRPVSVYTVPSSAPVIDAGNTISQTLGTLTISFIDVSNNPFNNISYMYYLYDASSGTNQYTNTLYYSDSYKTLNSGITQYSFLVSGTINKTYTVYLRAKNQYGFSANSAPYSATLYSLPSNISFDTGNTAIVSDGNLKVTINDISNNPLNGIYYFYSTDGGETYANSNVSNNGPTKKSYTLYIPYTITSTSIYVRAQNTVGNSNTLGVLFNNPTNTNLYINSNVQLTSGITQYSFQVSGLTNTKYTIFMRAKNTVGYSSNSEPYSVTVYTSPIASLSIDTNNTKTVASGNLQVSIIDLSNTSLNGVYYYYALNSFADASFANTFVRAGTSPYTFFIPSITDISNTIYVRASNTVGNSSPAANLQVIVYKTPRTPPQVSFQLVSSGNVQVTINESTNPPNYYYLNNVSYYLYAYNTVGGTNLSGNTSTLVYNRSVGILSNTNSSYGNVVSYVNTGLNANTYTMYVIATNPFGNSDPISSNITVYTTPDFPPKIDLGNTISASSGNVTVSFTDPSNNPQNAISYWYYVYDPSGTNQSGNISYYANSKTTLTTGTQQSFPLTGFINKTYTLYLLSRNVVGNSVSTSTNVTVYTVPAGILIDTANIKTVASGNLQVSLVDPSNGTNNGVFYQYSVIGINGNAYTNASAFSIGTNAYQFYIPGLTNATYTINVIAKNTVGNSAANTFSKTVFITPQYPPVIDSANTISSTSGNLTVSFLDTFNSYLNDISYSYYLYDISAAGTNNWNVPSSYISTTNKLLNGTTQYSFPITGLSNKIYALYFISQNSIGYSSNSAPYNVTVFTSPLPTVSFDTNNTKTVASGNLQVRLIDLSNTSLNGVYYQYALNSFADASFANTFIRAGTSPYTFFVPSITDISNTIYVRASNTIGNSSPAATANLQVIVYKTPRTPPQVSFQLVSSGNVQVTINESSSTPISYYYLNNVSYYLYAYNTVGGTNLSGNTSILVYNRSIGILSNTNSSYGNVVSYVNTGLNANTYTMYVIAKNPFGNSVPISSNITVYTTPDFPPKIDIGNTISATSGNLSVSFTDPSNNPQNAISYWYYVYDPSGTNNSGNISYYANSYTTLTTGAQQSFPLTGFINKTYTLYLLSRNVVGDSASTSTNVTVYTVPTDILIDNANTYTISSGNLQVSVVDSSNGTNNGVYYQYSVNSSQYANAENIVSIGSTIKQFIIPDLPNGSFSINVVAKNTVGTSNANTFTRISYVLPQYAPVIDQANTLSKTSGNLIITFTDASNVALNDITYSYYIYDPSPPYNKIVFI